MTDGRPEVLRMRLRRDALDAALERLGINPDDLVSLKMEGGMVETVHWYRDREGRLLVPPATVHRTYEVVTPPPDLPKAPRDLGPGYGPPNHRYVPPAGTRTGCGARLAPDIRCGAPESEHAK